MNDQLTSIMKQRGKVVALFVVCGTVIAGMHESAAASIFAALGVAVAALAGAEAWAAKGVEE